MHCLCAVLMSSLTNEYVVLCLEVRHSGMCRVCRSIHAGSGVSGEICGRLQDLVIPNLKHPAEIAGHSPLFGRAERERDVLMLFRGDVGKQRRSHYSRGIRQKLYALVWPLSPALAPRQRCTSSARRPATGCPCPAGFVEAVVRSRLCESP